MFRSNGVRHINRNKTSNGGCLDQAGDPLVEVVGTRGKARRVIFSIALDLDLDIADANRLLLFVGPEGGFAAEEHDGLLAQGALPVCLASANLRIEAAAAALAVLAIG